MYLLNADVTRSIASSTQQPPELKRCPPSTLTPPNKMPVPKILRFNFWLVPSYRTPVLQSHEEHDNNNKHIDQYSEILEAAEIRQKMWMCGR